MSATRLYWLFPWRWLGLSLCLGVDAKYFGGLNPHRDMRFYGIMVRHLSIGVLVNWRKPRGSKA